MSRNGRGADVRRPAVLLARSMDREPIAVCDGLHRTFGSRVAVDDLSFEVRAGECYALLGPNGAGKTTAISMLCGLLRPDRGRVSIAGHEPFGSTAAAAHRALGLVPQSLALIPELSVTENLDFWARLQGVPRRRRRARMDAVLEHVGLAERRRDTVDSCSGGMQRRLNLAVALLHEPALLVLDEPTVGVDPQSRNRLLDLVSDLRDAGTAVLYTSHYLEEVERVADRVGVVDAGRMLTEGTPAELLAASEHGAVDLEERFLELTGSGLRD
jgi:ABC-2 type transport system ATP-binding protein